MLCFCASLFFPVGGQNDLLGSFCLLLGGGFHALQRIGDVQFLVLGDTHDVIGQGIQRLHIVQGAQEAAQPGQQCGVVGNAGDHHMSDPDRDVLLVQIPGKGQDTGVVMTGQVLVALGIDVLDVQQHQICDFQQLVQLPVVFGVAGPVGNTGGVQTGVDQLLLGQLKQLQQKIDLHQGFAAGDGDAAGRIECLVPLIFLDQGLGGPDRAGIHFPGIRIMAVLAPHGTALEKDDESNAGAIHGAEAFRRMDIAVHRRLDLLVEGTGDDLILLGAGQLDEVDGIAADTDGQLGILFGMLLGIQQGFLAEDVDIQMMAALFGVAIQQGNQIVNLLFSCFHS